jgi:hypothetical protein
MCLQSAFICGCIDVLIISQLLRLRERRAGLIFNERFWEQ